MSFGTSVSSTHSPSEGNSQCVRGRQFASNDNDSPIDAQLFVLETRAVGLIPRQCLLLHPMKMPRQSSRPGERNREPIDAWSTLLCFAAHGKLRSDRAGIRGNIIFLFIRILAAQIRFKAVAYPMMCGLKPLRVKGPGAGFRGPNAKCL